MARFPKALVAALSHGKSVARTGWLNSNWHVEAQQIAGFQFPHLLRVTDGEHPYVWTTVTADDLISDDWVYLDGSQIEDFAVTEGTFASAAELLFNGNKVRRSSWLPQMHIEIFDDPNYGRLALINLPNGTKRTYNPDAKDLTSTNWERYTG